MNDYTITHIDYVEMDATLEVQDMQVYFQFNKEPSLYEAVMYLVKEAEKNL